MWGGGQNAPATGEDRKGFGAREVDVLDDLFRLSEARDIVVVSG